MQAIDRLADTSRWLRYAEEDLRTAETLLRQPDVPPRQACWCAQQSAEKTLKAVLIFLEIDFPRTHDLDALRNLAPESWQLKATHPDLASLTRWAVDARYPGEMPEATNIDASEAVEQARAVWTSVSTALSEHGYHVGQDF